ncbi:MAG: Omp28-related outer membrane protein [Chitinophagaceae bacterium]
MRKIQYLPSLLVSLILFSLVSCSKSSSDSGGGNNNTTPTSSFTRKAYVEDFTGTWCGWCPLMSHSLDQKKVQYGKKLIYVVMHYGPNASTFDPFHATGFTPLLTRYGINSFPTGLVDRQTIVSSSSLAGNIDLSVNTAAKVGIQLETTLNGNQCAIKTTVKFADNFSNTPVNLVLMLVEDSLKYNQRNFLNNNSQFSSHPYFTAGDPIPNYTHNSVFRLAINGIEGEVIPNSNTVINGQFVHNSSITVSAGAATNSRVIAIVKSDNGGISGAKVLNAQEVKIGQTQVFD